MNGFYNTVLAACAAIIGALTFLDDIAKRSKFLQPLKSLIIKIPFFILASVLALWATSEKENAANAAQAKSDSINTSIQIEASKNYAKKLDSSITENSRKYISALLEYGYSLDTAKNELRKLRNDTTKKSIINNFGEDPSVSVCPGDGIKVERMVGDTVDFKISICCLNAKALITNLKLGIIGFIPNNNYYNIQSQLGIVENEEMEKNTLVETVRRGQKKINTNIFIFYFTGSYKKPGAKTESKIDWIYQYRADGLTYGPMSPSFQKSARAFINTL